MTIKLLGAVCVILGCAGFGFMIAGNARKEISSLRQLITALEFMECELNYRMTPLPQLCRLTASTASGCVKKVFLYLADELEMQIKPSVEQCLLVALKKCPELPELTRKRFDELGHTLGMFDLAGQINSLKLCNTENRAILENISQDHTKRLRSYQTLGLCAGAALVILFI